MRNRAIIFLLAVSACARPPSNGASSVEADEAARPAQAADLGKMLSSAGLSGTGSPILLVGEGKNGVTLVCTGDLRTIKEIKTRGIALVFRQPCGLGRQSAKLGIYGSRSYSRAAVLARVEGIAGEPGPDALMGVALGDGEKSWEAVTKLEELLGLPDNLKPAGGSLKPDETYWINKANATLLIVKKDAIIFAPLSQMQTTPAKELEDLKGGSHAAWGDAWLFLLRILINGGETARYPAKMVMRLATEASHAMHATIARRLVDHQIQTPGTLTEEKAKDVATKLFNDPAHRLADLHLAPVIHRAKDGTPKCVSYHTARRKGAATVPVVPEIPGWETRGGFLMALEGSGISYAGAVPASDKPDMLGLPMLAIFMPETHRGGASVELFLIGKTVDGVIKHETCTAEAGCRIAEGKAVPDGQVCVDFVRRLGESRD